jgi:hypothetical protein
MTTRSAKKTREEGLSSKEVLFVRQFARLGAADDKLALAARRARITERMAQAMLKKPAVQHELALYKQILRTEQAKLDAKDIDRRDMEEDRLLSETERIALRKLNGLIEVDPATLQAQHQIQIQVLKLALVVTGTIRDGKTERMAPPDAQGKDGSAQVPGSFFERGMVAAEEAAPLYGEEQGAGVRDQGSDVKPETGNLEPKTAEPAGNEGPLEVKVGKGARK